MKNHVFFSSPCSAHIYIYYLCSARYLLRAYRISQSMVHLTHLIFCFLFSPFSDIKKQFTIAPQSVRVEAGGRAEIRCGAPEGIPKPKIQWLKNGSPIVQDSSVLVTNEGHILVSHAELPVRLLH